MLKVKKGDLVEVRTGKDKGKKGKVLKIYTKSSRVLVQGVNIVKKHMKQRSQDVPGGVVELEAGIHVSNVLPICSKCGHGVKTGYKILEDGSKIRICRKCKETV